MTTAYRLPPRAVIRLLGAGTVKFLHDVSTQDLLDVAVGQSRLTAFLTDKGRLLADARVIVLAECVLLEAEEAALAGLETALRTAPLAGVAVSVEPLWEHVRVTGDPGPLIGIGFKPGEVAGSVSMLGDVLCVAGAWGEDGWSLLCHDLASVVERIEEAGVPWGDSVDMEERRIAAGRPRFGVDVAAETLINETPLLRHAVSFTKGCYPGQESVARIQNLGRVKRLLRVLELTQPVEAGVPVLSNGEPVGTVTSAAAMHALAWISSQLEPGARVTLGGVTATVTGAG